MAHSRQRGVPSAIGIMLTHRVAKVLLLVALLALPTAPAVAAPVEKNTLVHFYYSPDWRPGSFSLLTATMADYLSSQGLPSSFQAFARYEDFVREIEVQKPTFITAPLWFAEKHGQALGLQVISRPLRNGKHSYRKLLMTGLEVTNLADLSSATIAATVNAVDPNPEARLLGLFSLAGSKARVIPVTKDIDALLALTFGQVDAAVVTTARLDLLSRVSPEATAKIHSIAKTAEIPFPMFYSTRYASEELRHTTIEFSDAFNATEQGQAILNLFGYDSVEIIYDDVSKTGGSQNE